MITSHFSCATLIWVPGATHQSGDFSATRGKKETRLDWPYICVTFAFCPVFQMHTTLQTETPFLVAELGLSLMTVVTFLHRKSNLCVAVRGNEALFIVCQVSYVQCHMQFHELFRGWTESANTTKTVHGEFLESSSREIQATGRGLKSLFLNIQVWPLKKGMHTFPFRRGDASNDPLCLKQTEPLWLFLLLPWRHFVSLTMFRLDSGIWNSSAPTSPTAQICDTSWTLHCLPAHPFSSRACRSPSFYSFFPLSLTPPLCLIFSCSLLSPLLPVKFHFTD